MPVYMDSARKRLAYLSGAPRVSTRPEAGAAGPRSHVLGVMRAFERLGWEVRPFIIGDRLPVAWIQGEQSAAALRGSWIRRAAADVVRLWMGWLNGWRAWKEIGPVDLVYERYGAFQALGWWFQRRGIPWILETNAMLSREATKDRGTVALGRLLRAHERWTYRRCDMLVCISEALADLVVHEMGIPAEKIIVLPNGVDVDHFDLEKARPNRFYEGPTIGFVGSMQPWQRLDLLLEALAGLREEGIVYHLVVVGDGAMGEVWKQHAGEVGLAEQVHFARYVPWDEVPAYIAGFDLGYAGAVPLAAGVMYRSPLKLYEYAAMGKPFVAAAYADAESLVADGARGYLFAPGNLEDLKRALRQAFADRSSWPAYRAPTRAAIIEKHSWEARVQELIGRAQSLLREEKNSKASG